MKNLISKHLFDKPYDGLTLASEMIVDLQMECIRNKVIASILFAALVFTIIGGWILCTA